MLEIRQKIGDLLCETVFDDVCMCECLELFNVISFCIINRRRLQGIHFDERYQIGKRFENIKVQNEGENFNGGFYKETKSLHGFIQVHFGIDFCQRKHLFSPEISNLDS